MERKPSVDLPSSILEAIKKKAEGLYPDAPQFSNEALRDIYTSGYKDAIEMMLGFQIWLLSYFDCDDFMDEPIWEGMLNGEAIKGTTIQLLEKYLEDGHNKQD